MALVIEGGKHVDSLVGSDPANVRPMLPCYRAAFTAMVAWVTHNEPPPASTTVQRPAGAAGTLLGTCSLD